MAVVTVEIVEGSFRLGRIAAVRVAEASVQLQFQKKGAASYSTVKTVKSSSTGSLKTTVTASADGYWRWNFGGWHTTGTAISSVDYVDVN